MIQARVAVIGGSWGGLDAVRVVLADLRDDLSLAVVLILHRGSDAPEDALVRYFQSFSSLPVAEVQDKDLIEPGHVYLAPPDYHLLVEEDHFALSLEAPVSYSRPSIDATLETAADAHGPAVVAVVLTGANEDGAAGLKAVKRHGGRTYVQDPATAVRAEMPTAAIRTGAADQVLSIEEIAAELNRLGAPR